MEHGDLLAKLLSLAAFILTLILTFAGTQYGGILDDLYLILLDVSKMPTNLRPNATELETYDFFTTHILTYCAGYYDGHGGRNTTMCTATTLPFAFDLAPALLQSLGMNQSDAEHLTDCPYAIISDFDWISRTSKAVSVLSILDIAVMGIGTLLDGLVFSPGRNNYSYPSLSRAFTFTSLLILITTAALSTFIDSSFVDLLNLHGEVNNITATPGRLFMTLMWLSVILCLVRNLSFLASLRIRLVGENNRANRDGEAIGLLDSSK